MSGPSRARRKRRCISPTPSAIYSHSPDLWESWKQPDESWLNTCTILTTRANEKIEPIHHRMTVIVEPEDYALWLAPRELTPDEWLPLVAGPTPDQLQFHEVSTQVNKPVNDNPTVIMPVDASPQEQLL